MRKKDKMFFFLRVPVLVANEIICIGRYEYGGEKAASWRFYMDS